MASFALGVVRFISHLSPTKQEIEDFFAEDSAEVEKGENEECDDEEAEFEFTEKLEQEHLEALEAYNALVREEASCPDDTPTVLYEFLQEKGDLMYPFGFWYECCASSLSCNFALAYIIVMMSEMAVSPRESMEALFTTGNEAVNGIFEYEEDAYRLLSSAIDISRFKLMYYVPLCRQMTVSALVDDFLETIDRGDDQMDKRLFDIEEAYSKLLSAH